MRHVGKEPSAVLVRARSELDDAALQAAAADCVERTLARLPEPARELLAGHPPLF